MDGGREAPNLLDVSLAKACLFYELGDADDSGESIKRSPPTEHRSPQLTCSISEKHHASRDLASASAANLAGTRALREFVAANREF